MGVCCWGTRVCCGTIEAGLHLHIYTFSVGLIAGHNGPIMHAPTMSSLHAYLCLQAGGDSRD